MTFYTFFLRIRPDKISLLNILIKKLGGPYQHVECKRHGQKPVLQKYNSASEEINGIVREITRLVNNERVSPRSIAILHPSATPRGTDTISFLMQSLQQAGIPCIGCQKMLEAR